MNKIPTNTKPKEQSPIRASNVAHIENTLTLEEELSKNIDKLMKS